MSDVMAEKKEAQILLKRLESLTYNKGLKAWLDYLSGRVDNAVEYWEKIAKEDSHKGLIAQRSLAVHFHSKAYEAEIHGPSEEALTHWERSLKLWASVFNSRAFRAQVSTLTNLSEQEALLPEEADGMVAALSECVMSPNEVLVIQAIENEKYDKAEQHVQMLRKAGFKEEVVNAVLDRVAENICPIRQDVVTHTFYTTESASFAQKKAMFTVKQFPDKSNGYFASLVVAIALGKKTSLTGENAEQTLGNIKSLKTKNILAYFDAFLKESNDKMLQELAKNRLRELTDVSCRIGIRIADKLFGDRNQIVGGVNSAVQTYNSGYSSSSSELRRKIIDAISWGENLDFDKMENNIKFSTSLSKKYGDVNKLIEFKETVAQLRKDIASDRGRLVNLRSQLY